MGLGEFLSSVGIGAEVLGQGNARLLPLQVLRVLRTVFGIVQNAVEVIVDIPLGDFLCVVTPAEMFQRPVGGVFVRIRRTRATSGLSRQIERQIAYVA